LAFARFAARGLLACAFAFGLVLTGFSLLGALRRLGLNPLDGLAGGPFGAAPAAPAAPPLAAAFARLAGRAFAAFGFGLADLVRLFLDRIPVGRGPYGIPRRRGGQRLQPLQLEIGRR